MSVTASQLAPTIVGTPPGGVIPGTSAAVPPGVTPTGTDNENITFQFVAGWALFLLILKFISMNRFGYVLIYYGLLLLILLIIVTEYSTIVPLLDQVQTIGMFNKRSV